MTQRPLVAFLTSTVPHPPPLNGSMLRVARLVRELNKEFDVAVICQSDYDAETLGRSWDVAQSCIPVVSVPKPRFSPNRDALWGSPASVLKSTFFTLLPNRAPRIFDWAWSDDFVEEIRQLLRQRPVDVVWATKSWMAEMARAAGAQRIIVDIDDFQGALMLEQLDQGGFSLRKPFHKLQAKHLVEYERDLPSRFTSVAVCKPEDLSRLTSNRDAHPHVVPNGVDVPDTVDRDKIRRFEMLFVGTLGWEPNVEALASFVTHSLPAIRRSLPDSRLVVAGRGPIPDNLARLLNRDDVEIHESPPSLVEFYARAAISVIPLLTGGGTSIKTIESLAYALPTVATSVAARGLGMQHGRHLLIADTPAELARCCIHLLTNPEEARMLGVSGREEVIQRLSWESVGDRARAAVREVLGGKSV